MSPCLEEILLRPGLDIVLICRPEGSMERVQISQIFRYLCNTSVGHVLPQLPLIQQLLKTF